MTRQLSSLHRVCFSSGTRVFRFFFSCPHTCNGQIVGQPRRWESRQNVRKMSKKCPKIVQKLSRGAESTIFGHFLDNFCLFGRCFCLVTLSNARPFPAPIRFAPTPPIIVQMCAFGTTSFKHRRSWTFVIELQFCLFGSYPSKGHRWKVKFKQNSSKILVKF